MKTKNLKLWNTTEGLKIEPKPKKKTKELKLLEEVMKGAKK